MAFPYLLLTLLVSCLYRSALATGFAPGISSRQSLTQSLFETTKHIRLTRIGNTVRSKIHRGQGHSTIIRPLTFQTQYAVEVKFNDIPRYLLLDTGSSDTWMVGEAAKCLNSQLKPVPTSACRYGAPYTGKFDPIKHVNYQQQYGSGEVVLGRFGYADVTVAGISVKHQQVALVDRAHYLGNGIMSGVIGLASRRTTMEFPGTHPLQNQADQVMRYSPIFESMYNATGQIKPLFSLALDRGSNGGYLAFGGLPPINFSHDFVTSKFVGVPFQGHAPRNRYYPIQPDGYELAGAGYNTSYVGIVDSGTYACRLPKEMADKINTAFNPPAKYIPSIGLYKVSCNATAPVFGFKIGGKTFRLHQNDMFLESNGFCATTITRGLPVPAKVYPDGFFILGGAFLHNVVAVFDVEHEAMHFASH